MMAKRKHDDVDETPEVFTELKEIFTFGTAGTEQGVLSTDTLKKRKFIHQRPPTPPVEAAPVVKPSSKRKRDLNAVEEEPERVELVKPAGPSIFARFARPQIICTPRNKRWRNNSITSPTEISSTLFDKLALDSRHSSPEPEAECKQMPGLDTPPDTPEAEKLEMESHLPYELQEFVRLHAAFLGALSMYYAHNGVSSPVSMSTLLPMIKDVWKKRTVTVDDVRRLLAVRHTGGESFKLEDFGQGGVCLVRVQNRQPKAGNPDGFIDEAGITSKFEAALEQQWLHWADDATSFIDELPIANVTKNASADKAAPVFTRGRSRLADFKTSMEAHKPITPSTTPPRAKSEDRSSQATQTRGSSLLDRILAKQEQAAAAPVGPSKEELERKAALHRVEEICRVLDLLAGARPRASFSMPSIVTQLQQSMRNPISRDEVERCLGLMAGEVCPTFVQVIVSGLVAGVVITKGGKLGLADLKENLAAAGA